MVYKVGHLRVRSGSRAFRKRLRRIEKERGTAAAVRSVKRRRRKTKKTAIGVGAGVGSALAVAAAAAATVASGGAAAGPISAALASMKAGAAGAASAAGTAVKMGATYAVVNAPSAAAVGAAAKAAGTAAVTGTVAHLATLPMKFGGALQEVALQTAAQSTIQKALEAQREEAEDADLLPPSHMMRAPVYEERRVPLIPQPPE